MNELSDDATLELPAKTYAEHVLTLAYETEGYNDRTTDNVEWEWGDKQITDVFTDDRDDYDLCIVVLGTIPAQKVEKVASARKNPAEKAHPAEFERHDVQVAFTAVFFPTQNNGLGKSNIEIDKL